MMLQCFQPRPSSWSCASAGPAVARTASQAGRLSTGRLATGRIDSLRVQSAGNLRENAAAALRDQPVTPACATWRDLSRGPAPAPRAPATAGTKPSTRKNSTHATPSRSDCVVRRDDADGESAPSRPWPGRTGRTGRRTRRSCPRGARRPIRVRLAACIGPMQKPSSRAKAMNTFSCAEPNRPRVGLSGSAGMTNSTRSAVTPTMPMRGDDHAGDGELHRALAADAGRRACRPGTRREWRTPSG